MQRSRSLKIIYFSKLSLMAFSLIFILCLVFFSDTTLKASAKGLNLWFNVVFPSLFPFFVAVDLLYKSGFVRSMGILLEPVMRPVFNVPGCGSFALLMGITSGYPVGAKITSDLRGSNMVTKAEAERLLAFTNNSGPLFIIGAVSSGILKMPEAGIFLYICHIMSCFTVGILFRFYNRSGNAKFRSKESFKGNHNPAGKNILQRLREDFYKKNDSEESFSIIFGDSIRNSIALILNIGGFVIFFSVIINVFIELELINNLSGIISVITGPLALNKGILNSIMCGFLEITTGVNHISSVANVSVVEKLTSASFIIGWAGLSVHSQVSSIISNSGISIKPYLIGKFMQGCFAGIYTYILAGFFDFTSKSSINTFNPADMKNQNFLHEKIILFFDSGLYAVIFLIVCIMVSYVSKKIIKVTEKKH